MSDYINIEDVVKDKKRLLKLYQAQNINDTTVKLVFMGLYEHDVLCKILSFKFMNILCDIISYTITENEIERKELNIIGVLLRKNNSIIGHLVIKFITDDVTNINHINGSYWIALETIIDNNKISEKIEQITKYPGNDELINTLLSYIAHEQVRRIIQ